MYNHHPYIPPGRLPPIAVKLNGETARMKPSRARYSTRLRDFGNADVG